MLFNSLDFLLFFPVVCMIYWAIRYIMGSNSLFIRNLFLLVASYYFYMCWQPAYAFLLLFSTATTYAAGILIGKCHNTRDKKLCLTTSLIVNLAILFFYKYYGFFVDNVSSILYKCGFLFQIPGFDVLLPVGISFYIFQAVGYSIDVYRGDIKPEKNFAIYALFVSFFPQLVAGPIERSTNLLKQFHEDRPFNYEYAISGFKLMLWGYFLKLCVADRAALYVDKVFNHLDTVDWSSYNALIAAILFTIQIYGDFAGYTFIAIGCARILSFNLRDNFRRPYLSTSITDFWRRWHISLSSWLRDYVYFPLGGSRTTKYRVHRNLMITFLVSGLWHGANWTFVAWGGMHGMLMCIERALGINKARWKSWKKLIRIAITFFLVMMAWVLFRADTFSDAMIVYRKIFSANSLVIGHFVNLVLLAIPISIVIIKEVFEEHSDLKSILPQTCIENKHAIEIAGNYLWPFMLLLLIGFFGIFEGGQFIYFQF